MRQKDDLKFAELLNRLRNNSSTAEVKEILRKCETDSCAESYQLNAPHLFAEIYFMHMFNNTIINSLNTDKVTIPCHDCVPVPKLSKENKLKLLKYY